MIVREVVGDDGSIILHFLNYRGVLALRVDVLIW